MPSLAFVTLICSLYFFQIALGQNLCKVSETIEEGYVLTKQAHEFYKFAKFCNRAMGEIYDAKDRDEVIGLGLGLGANDAVWTSAGPSLASRPKYYQFKKGTGDLVMSPETQGHMRVKNRRHCLSYQLGDAMGKYMPTKCSRKRLGICKAPVTVHPQYFQLLWDSPVTEVDIIMEGNCEFIFEAYSCDTGDGGQYCKTADVSGGSTEGERYYIEPGSNSNVVLLYSIFWEYLMTPNTGNIRLEVHYGGQTINTIYPNWNEQLVYPLWVIGCVDTSLGVQSFSVVDQYLDVAFIEDLPTPAQYC